MNLNIEIAGKEIHIKENLVDKAVRYFSPEKGLRRFRQRCMGAIAGAYVGASRSRRHGMSSWNARPGDSDSDLLPELPILRDRSSDLVRNNPVAGGALNTVTTNAVGSGLKLQSRIDRKVLGMDEGEADELEALIEREWRLLTETKELDIARTLNFSAHQTVSFYSMLERGDCFTLMPYLKRPGSPYGLKLQLVEGDRVSNPGSKADTQFLSGGIEKDKNGAPVFYHILDQHPGRVYGVRSQAWTAVSAFGFKTGRQNVIHLFDPRRPGQTRGVPYLAPVMEALKQLGEYTTNELMATTIASMLTVFVKSELGDGGFSPFSPTSESGGSTTDEDYKLGNGAIIDLLPGESVETVNPGRPNPSFDPFFTAILRQIGARLEIPFEILIKHFTSSFSASQAAMLELWKFITVKRAGLATNLCSVVYEAFMWEAVAIGRIHAPGFMSDPIIRKAYLGAEWIGPAKGMIDELKAIKAAELRMDRGVTTLQEETAQMTGGDWERKHLQTVKEMRKRKEDGVLPEKKAVTELVPATNEKDDE